MSRLLIDEPPLQVLPSLAVAIGLNEAMLLQQVHYWLQRSKHVHDERPWVYNTYEEWQAQFPFWSLKTVRNVIASLEKQGLLLSGHHSELATDRTKWYTIDYAALERIELSTPGKSIWQNLPHGTGKPYPLHPAGIATSSISTETTPEINQQEELVFVDQVVAALENVGIAPKTAKELAGIDPDLAAAWLEAKQVWGTARNPAALLVKKIRDREEPPKPRPFAWPR